MRFASVLAGALLAITSSAFPQTTSSSGAPGISLESCRLQHSDRLQSVEAQCATLSVPENPLAPEGAQVGLRVAVVRALNREGAVDPVFVLAGGPGQAATEFYAMAAGAFDRVHRERDIVLVDQRGTGGSNPLSCPFPDEDDMAEMSSEQVRAFAQACLASLKHDPRYYTTSVAVRDLERVRAALGYARINLYGISYGTRVAQHYVRRYPQRVRAVVLDGVVPPENALGVDSAIHAQRALESIFSRCAGDKACRQAFPDPLGDFKTLRETLAKTPAEVSIPDPVTAQVKHSKVRSIDLQMAVRLLSYGGEQAALLPLLLHEGVRGNLGPIAGQAQMIEAQIGDALSVGMHNAVVCTEDVPFYTPSAADREALELTYMGTLQLDNLMDTCAAWPKGLIDPDLHAPLKSAAPALLLSGSADPVTPPAYAGKALAGFSNGVHVVMNGQGHGQLALGCIPNVIANFFERGSARGLDVSCTRKVTPAPFFVSFSGPTP